MTLSLKQPAEAILTDFFGEKVRLSEPHVLTKPGRRNTIARVVSETGESFIVKAAVKFDRNDPNDGFTRGFSGDWAGLQFLSSLPNADLYQSGPKFYGGDLEAGLMVLEDLGTDRSNVRIGEDIVDHDKSLVQALLGDDPHFAFTGLKNLMVNVAQVHWRSRDAVDQYIEIYNSINDNCPYDIDYFSGFIADDARDLDGLLTKLGIKKPPGFDAELKSLAEPFRYGSRFTTLIHSDPCPDNCRYTDTSFRLIDYEFAGLAHAFRDGVFGRASFPSCWCAGKIPESVVVEMERIYRDELSKGFPEILDDEIYKLAQAEGHAFWALVEIRRCRFDWPANKWWGPTQYGKRMQTRLKDAAETLNELGYFPDIADVAMQANKYLTEKFGELPPLEYYPAFRQL